MTYFKNKSRQFKQEQKPYVPEYKRLGIDPVLDSVQSYDRDVFRRQRNRPSQEERVSVPKQVKVVSGMNEDHAWRSNKQSNLEPSQDINIGDFIIMYSGKILFVGSQLEAEDFVWDLLAGETEFGEVPANDILVMKRLAVKIGAAFEINERT